MLLLMLMATMMMIKMFKMVILTTVMLMMVKMMTAWCQSDSLYRIHPTLLPGGAECQNLGLNTAPSHNRIRPTVKIGARLRLTGLPIFHSHCLTHGLIRRIQNTSDIE